MTGDGDAPPRSDRARDYWRRNLRISALLLSVWFGVTFVVAWFARSLSFEVLGWPLSFWVAAQGAILVYLLIIAIYARRMARLDREHGVDEDD
jgi:putative solute:sodium symporter small subunit